MVLTKRVSLIMMHKDTNTIWRVLSFGMLSYSLRKLLTGFTRAALML